jgi:hypothetical protein
MRKNLILVLVFVFIVTALLTIIQKNTHAIGEIKCICQSSDCEEEMEDICRDSGYEFAGYVIVAGICWDDGSGDCTTFYNVFCDMGNRRWSTCHSCDCFTTCYD